jgi:hypothetical protein
LTSFYALASQVDQAFCCIELVSVLLICASEPAEVDALAGVILVTSITCQPYCEWTGAETVSIFSEKAASSKGLTSCRA